MHNGFIDGFAQIKRDLVLAIDESLYPEITGQTDTEVLFYLALTFGPRGRPTGGGRAGDRDGRGRRGRPGIMDYPFQGTIATTNGESMWVFRYSSQGRSRSLFFSRDVRTLRQQYPDREILRELSDDARLIVSEPIGDLPGAWKEMPESSYGVSRQGKRPAPALCAEGPAKGEVADIRMPQLTRPASGAGCCGSTVIHILPGVGRQRERIQVRPGRRPGSTGIRQRRRR